MTQRYINRDPFIRENVDVLHIVGVSDPQGPFYEHVLTSNPSIDMSIFPVYIVACNYLSIPKFQL